MKKEKLKERQEAAESDPSIVISDPPSPIARHDKWKRARLKKPGVYITEEARIVADKIVSIFC